MEEKFVQDIQKLEKKMSDIKIAIHEAQLLFEHLLNKVNTHQSSNQNQISELISEYRSKTMCIWMTHYLFKQQITDVENELVINQQHPETVQRFSIKCSALQNESEMMKILIDNLRNFLEQNRHNFLKVLVAKTTE